jgi:glucose-6-phosphate 1-dehydrogenase
MNGITPDPHVIVLFGATGDLAARKLLPGLDRLARAGLMPEGYRIIGTSRRPSTDDAFRAHAADVVGRFGDAGAAGDDWDRFAAALSYVSSDASAMDELAGAVGSARDSLGGSPRTLAYLSIPPAAMAGIVGGLAAAGLAGPGSRVILEKPFGTDAASARALNDLLHGVFDEDQVFRIDHFLGKEDVQNILAVRFANRLFEPVWCSEHVSELQIDVPETLGVEDRAAFYEATGAFRDMIVTHLFQALGFVAMEPPGAFSPEALASGRQAVFDALQPLDPTEVVRGQYTGYRDLPGVAGDSDTETMVAVRAHIDNDRWRGVPVLLRTGKRMPEGRRVITLTLKDPPMEMFPTDGRTRPDQLVFEIGEPGTIRVNFLAKEPGPTMTLGEAHLDFAYGTSFDARCELEAYQRLLHDAMLGDRTLFNTAEGIERLWDVGAPLLADPPPVVPYEPGTWGPPQAAALVGPHGWYLPVD